MSDHKTIAQFELIELGRGPQQSSFTFADGNRPVFDLPIRFRHGSPAEQRLAVKQGKPAIFDLVGVQAGRRSQITRFRSMGGIVARNLACLAGGQDHRKNYQNEHPPHPTKGGEWPESR